MVYYAVLIFMGEYLFGSILKTYGICPWDYTGLHSNVNGLIRLDFAPLWFATGLILSGSPKEGGVKACIYLSCYTKMEVINGLKEKVSC